MAHYLLSRGGGPTLADHDGPTFLTGCLQRRMLVRVALWPERASLKKSGFDKNHHTREGEQR